MAVPLRTPDTGAHRFGRRSFCLTRVQTLHGADARAGQHKVQHTDQRTDVQGVPHTCSQRHQQPKGTGCQHRRRQQGNLRETETGWQVGQDKRELGMHLPTERATRLQVHTALRGAGGQLPRDGRHNTAGQEVQRRPCVVEQDGGLERVAQLRGARHIQVITSVAW